MTPEANDELAEPVVWERLLSSMVALPVNLPKSRKNPMVITATGMEVETVNPARSPRYAFAAPNKMPKIIPMITDLTVNSAIDS